MFTGSSPLKVVSTCLGDAIMNAAHDVDQLSLDRFRTHYGELEHEMFSHGNQCVSWPVCVPVHGASRYQARKL